MVIKMDRNRERRSALKVMWNSFHNGHHIT